MSVEAKLFDFEASQGDAELVEYFNLKLKVKLGEFEAGKEFTSAVLDNDKGTLSLYNNSVLLGRFSVELVVTKDLLNEE